MGRDKCDNCGIKGLGFVVKGISKHKWSKMSDKDRPQKYGEIKLCPNCKDINWKKMQHGG